jgi:hypothetical protein
MNALLIVGSIGLLSFGISLTQALVRFLRNARMTATSARPDL